MALDLLRHAIKMIFDNIGEAIKASALPLVVLFAIGLALGGSVMDDLIAIDAAGGDLSQFEDVAFGPILFRGFLFLIAYLFFFGWLAVTWHRFILLGEVPATIPALGGKNVGAYVAQLVSLFVLLFLIAIAVGIVAGLITVVVPLLGVFAVVGIVFIVSIIYLRLALTLPAVAVGQMLSFRSAWDQTKPFAGTFIGVFFLLVLIRLVVGLPGALLNGVGLGIIATAVDLLASWFTLMVGVGILTTLYGHIVEGRELN